jgi:hypothetical protein
MRIEERQPNSILALKSYFPLKPSTIEQFSIASDKIAPIGQVFGFELEFYIPYGEYDEDCDGSDIARDLTRELVDMRTNVHYDMSVRDNQGDRPYIPLTEVMLWDTPPFTKLRQVCTKLRRMGARVNSSTGLHIHLDCRDGKDKARSRFRRLARSSPLLYEIVAPSRRYNQFVRWDNLVLHDQHRSGYDDRRYQVVNFMSYNDHQTIEFRGHHGTLNPQKIVNFAQLLKIIADNHFYLETWEKIQEVIPPALYEWCMERKRKLTDSSDGTWEESEV